MPWLWNLFTEIETHKVTFSLFLIGLIAIMYVNYKLRAAKDRRESRKKLLEEVEEFISQEHVNKKTFYTSSQYKRFRPYMTKEAIDEFEMKNINMPKGIPPCEHIEIASSGFGTEINPFKQLICNEIARLRKEWEIL